MADLRRGSDGGIVTEDREPKGEPRGEPRGEARDAKPERAQSTEIKEVRASDIEPYTGLRYLSKLFRFMAVILVLLLVAEVATGIYTQGTASVPTLLGEASRLIVLAGVLWGTGDLAHLLIDVGHDVRAARILVARVAHAAKVAPLSVPRTAAERNMLVTERNAETARSDTPLADRPAVPRRTLADRIDSDEDGPPIP
ncbi:MAG: hypothetical protein JWM41_126 [Gemmatimonadetes bacterium]|nr:hypothetical protein [Gemmatimonadota bacterium]